MACFLFFSLFFRKKNVFSNNIKAFIHYMHLFFSFKPSAQSTCVSWTRRKHLTVSGPLVRALRFLCDQCQILADTAGRKLDSASAALSGPVWCSQDQVETRSAHRSDRTRSSVKREEPGLGTLWDTPGGAG